MYATGKTDIGKVRSVNQDAIFVSTEPIGALPNLFIVADGMGGHNGGEVASRQALEAFCAYVRHHAQTKDNYLDLLVAAAKNANEKVFQSALADPALFGMGTTLTGCVIYDRKCAIVHIGDSRAYMITPTQLAQLTNDHSYVNEMVKAGHLTPEQAREHPKRNILTRVLGVDLEMTVDGYVRELADNAVLLLCSDGLTNMLTDEEIAAIVLHAPFRDKAGTLIEAANLYGGIDNISVILIDGTENPNSGQHVPPEESA